MANVNEGERWTIKVCPECDRISNACEHVEFQGAEPLNVEVVPHAADAPRHERSFTDQLTPEQGLALFKLSVEQARGGPPPTLVPISPRPKTGGHE